MRRAGHLALHAHTPLVVSARTTPPPCCRGWHWSNGLEVQRHLRLKIQYAAGFIPGVQVDVIVLQIKNLNPDRTKAALPEDCD